MNFTAGACTCSFGFKSFNVGTKNTCLMLQSKRDRVYKAVNNCKKYNSQLPLPTNAIENEKYRLAVKSLISSSNSKATTPYGVALDLNDIKKEGKYVRFSNGQSANWLNWYSGEPSNSWGGEDYVAMYLVKSTPNDWNDYSSMEYVVIVCEKNCQ